MSSQTFPPPPIFGVAGGDNKIPRNGIVSLVDIFDEFLFTSDKAAANPPNVGNSMHNTVPSSSSSNNMKGNAPFQSFNTNNSIALSSNKDLDELDYDSDEMDDSIDDKRRKRSRTSTRNMTEEQKVERRERNREHAKRSRVRKKFLLDSLQQSVHALEEENDKLRSAIRHHLKGDAEELLSKCTLGPSVIASDPSTATTTLNDPDYSLVKALQTAQQNFVISDPSMPDNPIVYASHGFLTLTGYTLEEVLGRNCRFLQGPETDSRAVDRIRKGIEKGDDTTVVLLNYKKDGSTFWNQFFIAALRDGDGNIVNYLGVQCKVSNEYADAFIKSGELEDVKVASIINK